MDAGISKLTQQEVMVDSLDWRHGYNGRIQNRPKWEFRDSGFDGRFSEPGSVSALMVVERSGKVAGLEGSPRLDLDLAEFEG